MWQHDLQIGHFHHLYVFWSKKTGNIVQSEQFTYFKKLGSKTYAVKGSLFTAARLWLDL